MKRKTLLVILILLLMVIWQAASVDAAPDKKMKAEGILTSIESDGTVIINDKGFMVDPSARIYSARGERTTLDSLSLPAKTHYEFTYSAQGGIIILIREMGQ